MSERVAFLRISFDIFAIARQRRFGDWLIRGRDELRDLGADHVKMPTQKHAELFLHARRERVVIGVHACDNLIAAFGQARREGVTEPAVLLVQDHRQQSGMATPERVDCDVQGTSHAVLYQDNLLRRDGLADHAVKGFQEVGRILLPVDAHQHAVRGMRIEGLWIMGIQTLIQTHSLAPSGRGSKTDITAVIGSFAIDRPVVGMRVPSFPPKRTPNWHFQCIALTTQELPNPVHYLIALLFASPLDTPSPVTYLRGTLHRFPTCS